MSDSHTPPPEKKNRRRAPVVAIAVLMSMCMLSLAVIGPATQEAEAIPPLIIGGVVLGSFVAGWLMSEYFNQIEQPSSVGHETKAAYALHMRETTQNYLTLASAFATNQYGEGGWMESSSYKLARNAAAGATSLYDYQADLGQPHIYDASYVLSQSPLAHDLVEPVKMVAGQYGNIFSQYIDLSQTFVGTYEGMSWGFYPGQDAGVPWTSYQSSLSKYPYYLIAPTYQIIHSTSKYVIMQGEQTVYFTNYRDAEVTTTIKIVDSAGVALLNETLTFAPREIKHYSIEELGGSSGRYNLQSSDTGVIITSIAIKDLSNSAEIYPMLQAIEISGDKWLSIVAIAQKTSSSDLFQTIDWFTYTGKTTKTASNAWLSFRWGASLNDHEAFPIAGNGKILDHMWQMQTATQELLVTANAFGQTHYNMMVSTGGANRALPPDVIFPDPEQMEGMTYEQLLAIYAAYMNQAKDWFENYQYQTPNNITLSGGSLDLVVRGAIYDEAGTLLHDNQTVFTPYLSHKDMTLVIGNNTLDQSAFVLIWGSAESLDAFGNKSQTAKYLTTKVNYTLAIEEMYYKGVPVDEMELTVSKLSLIVGELDPPTPPPQYNNDYGGWLIANWYWVTVAVGAVTVIAAALLRNGAIAGVGLLIILAGLAGYAATEVLPEWWESVKPWIISQDLWRPGP